MKKFRNKNTGITLIALIITIIILLILAGVSIATLTGSRIFENARLAKEKTSNAQEKENSALEDYEDKINKYLGSNREENKSSIIRDINIQVSNNLNKIKINVTPETDDLNSIIGYAYIIKCENITINNILSKSNEATAYGTPNKVNNIIVVAINSNGDIVKKQSSITLPEERETTLISKNNLTAQSTNVTASSNHSGYDPYKAFDNSTSTFWCVPSSGTQSGWIQYDFETPAVVTKFELIGQNNSANDQYLPTEFRLIGSNSANFQEYSILGEYTISNATSKLGLKVEFQVEEPQEFRYYRIDIPTAQTYHTGIGIISYYGYIE